MGWNTPGHRFESQPGRTRDKINLILNETVLIKKIHYHKFHKVYFEIIFLSENRDLFILKIVNKN